MKRRAETEWAAVLQEYQEVMRARLGVAPDIAQRVAGEMLQIIRAHFGGSEVYVPRPAKYDEATVLREFNGRNHDAVCKTHGIHRATLWRILERDAARRKRAAAATAKPTPAPQCAGPRTASRDFGW